MRNKQNIMIDDGLWLSTVLERVYFLDGNFEIKNIPGGATVSVEIPLGKDELLRYVYG